MKAKQIDEKAEINEIENQMNTLKTRYDKKTMDFNTLSIKIEEKTKVLNEAKKAHNKVNKDFKNLKYFLKK